MLYYEGMQTAHLFPIGDRNYLRQYNYLEAK